MFGDLVVSSLAIHGVRSGGGLLTLAFRKNHAGVRFWLWLSASLKFLLPFSLLMSMGGHLHFAPAAQRIVTPELTFAVETMAQPFTPVRRSRSVAPRARELDAYGNRSGVGMWIFRHRRHASAAMAPASGLHSAPASRWQFPPKSRSAPRQACWNPA